jgi:hypothetical protein
MDLVRGLSLAVALVMVTAGLLVAPATSLVGAHSRAGHEHATLLSNGDQLDFLAGEDGFPDRRNGKGRRLSGGRAVAHRAGGLPVTTASATRKAPDGRFFRLGINGWEPTIGVDDKGRIFYQARNADLAPQVMRSTNEGHTWKKVSPTIGGVPAQPISVDPMLHLDKDTGRVFTNNIPPDITCQPISYSDDAGETWTTTQICGHFDHQNIFSGPPPEGGDQPSGYPNVVYYCAINLVMLADTSTATTCGRSLDGGLTWLPTGEPAYVTPVPPPEGQEQPWCDGAVGHGYVGPEGTVYLPRVWCGQPFLSTSHDEGLTWDQVQIAKNGGLGHEAGIAADKNGHLYFTWIAEDELPYLAVSRDGGKKWSKPMMIGPPGLKRARLPAIDIGDPGKIAITYIGSETPGEKSEKWKWNGYITITADAAATDPLFYTATINAKSHPLQVGECGSVRCHTLGDFFDVTIAPDGTPWAAYVDACFEPDECVPTFEAVGVRGESVVGRLVGGPKLR